MRPILLSFILALATPLYAKTSLRVAGAETVAIPGTELSARLDDVIDQRCPPDVDCFWEGMMRVELALFLPDAPEARVILCNQCEDGARSATQGGVTLTLVGLEPSTADLAKLTHAPDLTDYTVVLTATPAE